MFIKCEPWSLEISFPTINSRFKQALVFFRLLDIVNFRSKSLFVITLAQSKQIWSFDAEEMYTRSIVLVGVVATRKCNLRHQWQVMPLLIFGAKRK